MKRVSGIELARLRIAELIQFFKNVLSLVLAADPAALNVQADYQNLVAITDTLDEIYKTDTGSDITDEMVELDNQRDDAYIGMRDYCKAMTRHFNPTFRIAAQAILNNLALYGEELNRKPYQEQTSIFRNFLNDWQNNPNLTSALQTLNLTAWSQQMRTINDTFDEKYIERAQERGAITPEAIKNKRIEAYDLYYVLRDVLMSHYIINRNNPTVAQPYESLIQDLNGIIKNYNDALARRENPEDEDEEESEGGGNPQPA